MVGRRRPEAPVCSGKKAGDFRSTCAWRDFNIARVASSSRHCACELFAASHMSAPGTKRTFYVCRRMSVLGEKRSCSGYHRNDL